MQNEPATHAFEGYVSVSVSACLFLSQTHFFQIPVAVFVVLLEKERGQLHSTGCHLLSEEDLMHTAKESHAI